MICKLGYSVHAQAACLQPGDDSCHAWSRFLADCPISKSFPYISYIYSQYSIYILLQFILYIKHALVSCMLWWVLIDAV